MITFRKLGKLGRFGNQLFQYTGTRLYAELNGFQWHLSHWDGDMLFVLPQASQNFLDFLMPVIQLDDLKLISHKAKILSRFGLWKWSSMKRLYAVPSDNIRLYGYMQDEISISRLYQYRDRIKSWFHFRPEIENAMRQVTDKYRPWIATHIRRGDLVKRGLTVPIDRYIELIPSIIGSKNIFVATDSPSSTQELSGFRPFSIKYPEGIPQWAADFWMLKEAEALLAGGSTFAWWAAYLGNTQYYAPPLTHLWPANYTPRLERQNL